VFVVVVVVVVVDLVYVVTYLSMSQTKSNSIFESRGNNHREANEILLCPCRTSDDRNQSSAITDQCTGNWFRNNGKSVRSSLGIFFEKISNCTLRLLEFSFIIASLCFFPSLTPVMHCVILLYYVLQTEMRIIIANSYRSTYILGKKLQIMKVIKQNQKLEKSLDIRHIE